jgi:hypothetical protein
MVSGALGLAAWLWAQQARTSGWETILILMLGGSLYIGCLCAAKDSLVLQLLQITFPQRLRRKA